MVARARGRGRLGPRRRRRRSRPPPWPRAAAPGWHRAGWPDGSTAHQTVGPLAPSAQLVLQRQRPASRPACRGVGEYPARAPSPARGEPPCRGQVLGLPRLRATASAAASRTLVTSRAAAPTLIFDGDAASFLDRTCTAAGVRRSANTASSSWVKSSGSTRLTTTAAVRTGTVAPSRSMSSRVSLTGSSSGVVTTTTPVWWGSARISVIQRVWSRTRPTCTRSLIDQGAESWAAMWPEAAASTTSGRSGAPGPVADLADGEDLLTPGGVGHEVERPGPAAPAGPPGQAHEQPEVLRSESSVFGHRRDPVVDRPRPKRAAGRPRRPRPTCPWRPPRRPAPAGRGSLRMARRPRSWSCRRPLPVTKSRWSIRSVGAAPDRRGQVPKPIRRSPSATPTST